MSDPQCRTGLEIFFGYRLKHSRQGKLRRDARAGAVTPAIGNRRFDQPPLSSSFFLSAEAAEDDVPSSGSPFSIMASILGKSSGSGFRSRAWAHWNLASRVRPTRQ